MGPCVEEKSLRSRSKICMWIFRLKVTNALLRLEEAILLWVLCARTHQVYGGAASFDLACNPVGPRGLTDVIAEVSAIYMSICVPLYIYIQIFLIYICIYIYTSICNKTTSTLSLTIDGLVYVYIFMYKNQGERTLTK